MGVSINGGSPKWRVYNGQSIYKWMMTGGIPHDLGNHIDPQFQPHIASSSHPKKTY